MAERWRRVSLSLLLLFALILPFEQRRPWIQVGPAAITNLELGLLLVLAAAGAQAWRRRRDGETLADAFGLPAGWAWLWGLIAAGALLATLLAPEEALAVPGLRLNALKATGRTLAGMGLALAVPLAVRRPRDARLLLAALLIGGAVSVGLGLLEVWRAVPLAVFDPLRTRLTTVGPFLRLTASYDHANQAAMAIEATLPLLLVATWTVWRAGRRPAALALGALAALFFQGLLLTYSRAGLVTALLVSAIVAAFLFWRAAASDRRQALWWAGATVAAAMLALVNTVTDPVWDLRLQSEDDKTWYRVSIEAPASLALSAGDTAAVDLVLRNEGALTWVSAGDNPIQIGARWREVADGRRLAFEPRWPLDEVVRPGGVARQTVALTAPEHAGTYDLVWDMVQEQITWFGEKIGQEVVTRVTVTGTAAEARPLPAGEQGTPAVTPAPIPVRGRLWRIAGQALLRFPWTGLGLDNFRLTYGRFLPADAWDRTIHTNNWFVETVVSLGLIGGLPFLVWLAWVPLDAARVLRRRSERVLGVGVAGSLLAFLIHGALDYFLMFNSTALLFWLLIGLWLSLRRTPAPSEAHAHRS